MQTDIISVMDDTVGRLQSEFPPQQLDLLVGSLLGDGRLECRSQGIRHEKTARFRVHHGHRQREYVEWKYDILKDVTSSGPKKVTRYDQKRDTEEISYYFHTRTLRSLGILHSLFYEEKRKVLPNELETLLSPQSLAVWFMDDGCKTEKSFILNTHNLNEKEQKQAQNLLRDLFSVNTTEIKDRHQTKLRVDSQHVGKFEEIVRPFLIPSMEYKIASPRND